MAKPTRLKVRGQPDLERDVGTNAIINSDTTSYRAFKARRRFQRTQETRLDQLEARVDSIHNKLDNLIELLNKPKDNQ